MHGMQTQLPQNRLNELIERDSVKPVHLAAHCDVDQSTLWRWRRNGPIPDEQKLRLAAYFDVSVPFLMGWDTDSPSEEAA